MDFVHSISWASHAGVVQQRIVARHQLGAAPRPLPRARRRLAGDQCPCPQGGPRASLSWEISVRFVYNPWCGSKQTLFFAARNET